MIVYVDGERNLRKKMKAKRPLLRLGKSGRLAVWEASSP